MMQSVECQQGVVTEGTSTTKKIETVTESPDETTKQMDILKKETETKKYEAENESFNAKSDKLAELKAVESNNFNFKLCL